MLLMTLSTFIGPTILSSVSLFLSSLLLLLQTYLPFSLFPKVSDPNTMAHRAELSDSWVNSSPLNSLLTLMLNYFFLGGGCDFRKSGKKSPYGLVVDEAVNDDNSVVALHPDTMEKLQLFRGDTILIKVSDLREFCVYFFVGFFNWFLNFRSLLFLWIVGVWNFWGFVLWVWCDIVKN